VKRNLFKDELLLTLVEVLDIGCFVNT